MNFPTQNIADLNDFTIASKGEARLESLQCNATPSIIVQFSSKYRKVFSHDEATLYEGVSVGRSVGWMDGWSVRNQFFFRPNVVYTALFMYEK